MYLPPDPPIPDPDPDCSEKVRNVETTIAKFKAAVCRVGFNIWPIFLELDEHKTHFISESKFLSVLMGPLRDLIGLESSEIAELTNFLRKEDGRIAYTQLCKLVHETENPFVETEEEKLRESPLSSNKLSTKEEDKVLDLLTKLAVTVAPRMMLLKPFFQDYELIRRGSGQVSRGTFKRVLNFIGFQMTPDEFELLFKKYRYDAFTMKYDAFLKELQEVRDWLTKYDYIDVSGAGRAQTLYSLVVLPQTLRPEKIGVVGTLPRPELQPAPRGPQHGIQKVWTDPGWAGSALAVEAAAALSKVREHVRRERLRLSDYFARHDESDSGRVPRVLFEKCLLEWVAVSETCFDNLYLSPQEVELLLEVYLDRTSADKVLWKVFMDDIQAGLDPKEPETWPRRGETRRRLNPFVSLHRPPSPPPSQEATLWEAMEHVRASMQNRPETRRMLTALGKRDTSGTGYLDLKLFEWTFVEAGVYLNQNEKERLREKYLYEEGVAWKDFVQDLQAHEESIAEASKRKEMEMAKMESQAQDKILAEMEETNIIPILAKIKKYLICKRVWIMDFLKEFDKHQKQLITTDEFLRGLKNCGLSLTTKEMETLVDVFSLPANPSLVEYHRFCQNVDEESLPLCLTRPPLQEAMLREEGKEAAVLGRHEFANFEERQSTVQAVDKLVRHVSLANTDFFKSIDSEKKGTISRLEFQRALHKLGCLHLLTNKELDNILLSFGLRQGPELQLDYRAFLNAMDIVIKTKKAAQAV